MKMIKNILIILSICFFFVGCTKKTDEIFTKPVDERLSEVLTNYQKYLTAAPGWKMFVYPKGLEAQNIKIGGFTYYLKLSNTNRVTMVSDFLLDTIAFIPKESGYRLKALQRPSLIFDTYSYMHIAADPDPNVSFSPTGAGGYGYGTDFNFSFTEVTPKDTMVLEGNFNNSSAVLVKATQAEMDAALLNQRLAQIIFATNRYATRNPYLYFTASPSQKIAAGFDLNKRFLTFSYSEAGGLVTKVVGFSFTTYGMHLQNIVSLGNYTFQDIYYDDAKRVYFILSGTNKVEFADNGSPLFSFSLTNTIGNKFTTITVPPGANLFGESPLFLTKYAAVQDAILAGVYGLDLGNMNFIFNSAAQSMQVVVEVFQNGAGPFLCQYNYIYQVDANGNFKFRKTTQNPNAALIVDEMANILDYIEADQFTIDGFPVTQGLLGQMKSKQNPLFYFTGNLY